jgi:hypothetical protein
MATLVVVPTLMLDGSFSAPLAWLFSGCAERVRGIYGFELTRELVQRHDRFIVELNWFIELHEFGLLVDFIRRHNPSATILFGGMYAGMHYPELMRRYAVDCFIQGDNELPIRRYLEGAPLRDIPNCVGHDFANPVGYVFTEPDYAELDFDLDWFPSYFRYRNPAELFQLPHLITCKGGCDAVHAGCDYCMGAQHGWLRELYGRPPIRMSNRSLMALLGKIQRRFGQASLYLTNAESYDFEGRRFELDVTIEIDSRTSERQVAAIFRAFRRVFLLVSAYDEGISGTTCNAGLYTSLIPLEDAEHQVRFYVFRRDAEGSAIPRDHVIFSDLAFPQAADWTFYSDLDAATDFSRRFYQSCARHFVDGTPRLDAKNPSYLWQNIAFAKGYPARGPAG